MNDNQISAMDSLRQEIDNDNCKEMRSPRVKTSKNYNQSNLSATERLQHNLEIQTHNAKIDKKKTEKKERKKLAKLRQELRQEITPNN